MIIKPRRFQKPIKGHILTPDLGLWLLNEAANDKVLDLSNNNKIDQAIGALEVNAVWSPSTHGPSVEVFDDESCINFGQNKRFDFTSEDFTLSLFWGSATEPSFNRQIVGRSSLGTNGWRFDVDFPIDQLVFKTGSGGGTVETTTKNVLAYDGHIYHIVITRHGAAVKIYIDGVDQTDSSGSHANPSSVSATNMYLGRGHAAAADVPGKFAGYSVYGRVLTPAEVTCLYRTPYCMFDYEPIELWSAATQGAGGVSETVYPDTFALGLALPVSTVSFDYTVMPDTLALALTLPVPTIAFPIQTVLPDTLQLGLTLPAPTVVLPVQTLMFYGTAGVVNVTPKFTFPSGTVAVWVEDIFIKNLTTAVEDDISLSVGEKLEYVCSDYDAITQIALNSDKISTDISGWTWPTGMTRLFLPGTGVTGDISGWTIPAGFEILDVSTTALSGDISAWTLPASTQYLYLYETALDYDSASGSFTDLAAAFTSIDFDDCSLTSSQVDAILADLVTTALENKNVQFGGTNASPSPSGVVDLNTLRARNWTVKNNLTVTPSTLALGLTLYAPVVWWSSTVSPSTLQLGLTLPVPSTLFDFVVYPSTLALGLVLESPTIWWSSTVSPSTLALGLTLPAPVVALGMVITPSVFELALTLHAPTALFDFVVTPSTLTLGLTLHVPTVWWNSSVSPSTLALALTLEASVVVISYIEIPPFMRKDLISPYSGGAWLWLVEIHFTGYDVLRLARNTEDVIYSGLNYVAHNIDIGQQRFASDGSIPRGKIRIAKDNTYVLEDRLNEALGATGYIKLIRVNERFLDVTIEALERFYNLLGASSDEKWLTLTLGVPNPLYKKIPLRYSSSKVCPYATPLLFKGVECQYTGPDKTCTGLYSDCFAKSNSHFWGGELGLDPDIMRV